MAISKIYINGFMEFIKNRLTFGLKANKISKNIHINSIFIKNGTKGTMVSSIIKIKAITSLIGISKGLVLFKIISLDAFN